jgi:hypothetical protein
LYWFENCFVPEVEIYLKNKKIAFKVLLVVDNAPGHPETLKFSNPNIRIIFLPPNTTSLIQPMDRGLIATFKSYYLRRVFDFILNLLDSDKSLKISDCWKEFNIYDCIRNISESRFEIKLSTLNACWGEIWPNVVVKDHKIPKLDEEIEKYWEFAKK